MGEHADEFLDEIGRYIFCEIYPDDEAALEAYKELKDA